MPHKTWNEENVHGFERIRVLTAVIIKNHPNIQTPPLVPAVSSCKRRAQRMQNKNSCP
jgi:hypothetical protein